jgi:protein-tyrosine phosphatase
MVPHIIMVCLGNICRSPLAEGILKTQLKKAGKIAQVDSAGTGDWHAGSQPDHRSIATARNHGIDITDQRARQFRKDDFEAFDYILVMDRSNLSNVLRLAETEAERNKVELILNYAYPSENREVPDPYYDDNGFEEVYEMLELACARFVEKL